MSGILGGSMARGRSNFKMGTVEMLVLLLLDKKDLYGYEISIMIKELSEELLVISESSLYPVLYKLLDKKYISDREVRIGKRRLRVYYHIEASGKQRLLDLIEDYRTTSMGIEKILNSSLEPDEDKHHDK